ncbi:hypothetical protein ADIWIN_1904 [Winogradskyella psychrotolerans RS-3]|uniref:Uncharacterized protein n=1 Tax=Winogradskyella psychrotolerans RS-3 TaxID=641526 RepID=S7XAU6_9FLAO|nr:hypothetical protein ADIWIN_1904 [Winogradskyella psychrotolerans RS-3]
MFSLFLNFQKKLKVWFKKIEMLFSMFLFIAFQLSYRTSI